MKKIKIITIIGNYKQYKELSECIKNLLNDNFIKKCTLEIVVIDGETDLPKAKKIRKQFPNICFISSSENLGVGKAYNIGFKYALSKTPKYVFLLAPDIYLGKNALNILVNRLETDKSLDVVGMKLLSIKKPHKILFVSGKIDPIALSADHIRYGEKDGEKFNFIKSTDFVNFPCLFRADILSKVGLMDENYFMYYEDIDWYTRIRKAGYRIGVEPSAVAYTDDSAITPSGQNRKSYYNSRNLLYYISKNYSWKKQTVAYLYLLKRIVFFLRFISNEEKRRLYFYEVLGIRDYLLRKFGKSASV